MKLNREAIRRMVDAGQMNIGARRNVSTGGGGGGVSQAWVDENYVSKEFFARLFTIHSDVVTQEDPHGEVVEPNDTETDIDNIELMFGAWTESYLSALGQGSGGGGGGSILTEPLASINEAGLGTPSGTSDQVIAYSSTLGRWHYADLGSGSGTVRSITLTTPQNSGLLVALGSGTPGNTATITNEGTFALSFGTGYSLVSPTDRSKWNAAADVADVTWWGQSIQSQTSGGVTTNFVSGNMTDVGSITMSDNIYMSRGKNVSFYYGNAYLGALGIFGDYDVLHLGYYTALEGIQTNVYGDIVRLYYGTSATLGMILNASGNVGIGQASPGYKLDVNGTINCTSIRIGGITITADTINGGLHVNSAGLYADTYISALGAGSGGGGGTVLTEPLATINEAGLGAPPSGQGEKVIAFGTNGWHYANLSSGSGTVISITAGTGLNGGTITTSGTLSIDTAWMNNNYLPLTLPSGGKTVTIPAIANNLNSVVTFKNAGSDYPLIRFAGTERDANNQPVEVGLGFIGIGKTNGQIHLSYVTADSNGGYTAGESQWYTIWHSGNFTPSDYLTKPTGPYSAWGRTYYSNGAFSSISGEIENADDIKINNNHFLRVKLSDNTTYINMMGIDSNNNISICYGAYVNSLTPYIYGNEVGVTTGSGPNSAFYSTFRSTGHLTINAYDNLDSTVFRNPTPFLIVGGGICGTGLFTNASVGETIKLHTTSTYNCIQFFTGVTSQWSVGTNNNGTFYWYTQPGGNKTVMSLTSGGNLGIGRTPGYKLDVNGTINCTSIRIGGITITADTNNGGLHVNSAGLYADTYLSALGAGSGGGSGSGITMADVWSAMATPAPSTAQEQIEASHLTQALSGYASKTWVQQRGYLTSNEAVTLSTAQTISAAKIFGAGLKSYSICIETKIDGTADTNRSGEINRYGSDLHLQHHNQTGYTSGGITMCNNGGSVAIGYSSQDSNYKLKVNGKVRISDQIGVNADVASDAQCMLNVNGTAKSLGWNTYSDIRLKDVINPVTANVEDIANVRIFDFRWKKDGKNGNIHFGSAAQDWQTIFPHAVVADKEGFLSMDYAGIAVGAVKTVAQEVVLLKKRVTELEKQLKAS